MTRDDIKKEFLEQRANGFVVGVPSDQLCDELIWLRRVRDAAMSLSTDLNNWGRKMQLKDVLDDRPP